MLPGIIFQNQTQNISFAVLFSEYQQGLQWYCTFSIRVKHDGIIKYVGIYHTYRI